jgi:asparagine synthase (glutamine-hydrolysing)
VCGIAGYFGRRKLGPEYLDACRVLMRRRGPDQEGSLSLKMRDGSNLYFLHSRLSIIDLDSRAQQPFSNGNDALCYNGEVYNYLELRSRLAGIGISFETTSDTEVLAKLLSQDGIRGISA